jgi:Zn-dependent protease with chaperone function
MPYAVAIARLTGETRMPAPVRSLGFVVVLATLLTACATTGEIRATRPDEQKRVTEVLTPLVNAAYGAGSARCRLGTGVREADNLDAWIVAAPDAPCDLRVVLTERAIEALTPRALQMLLAHELGHVLSQHPMGRARQSEIQGARTDSGYQSRLRTSGQQFNPDEEAGADGAAARILTVAWRGNNVGCLGLADFYEDIAKDRKPWGEWLSRHPFPERRVDALVELCDTEQRRAR